MVVFSTISVVFGAVVGAEGGDKGYTIVVVGEGGRDGAADSCYFSKEIACMARAR